MRPFPPVPVIQDADGYIATVRGRPPQCVQVRHDATVRDVACRHCAGATPRVESVPPLSDAAKGARVCRCGAKGAVLGIGSGDRQHSVVFGGGLATSGPLPCTTGGTKCLAHGGTRAYALIGQKTLAALSGAVGGGRHRQQPVGNGWKIRTGRPPSIRRR